MPAITVMSRNTEFKAFAARLAARGKSYGVILGAVMRKLLHIIYGVVKHKAPYNPQKVLGQWHLRGNLRAISHFDMALATRCGALTLGNIRGTIPSDITLLSPA